MIWAGPALALNESNVIFRPQVTIPGSEYVANTDVELSPSTRPIARYIRAIYVYGVGAVGIISAIMLMLGGVIWLTSAGSSTQVEKAKTMISSSLIGMVLVLSSYVLLKQVNPDLVEFKLAGIETVKQVTTLTCCGGSLGIKEYVVAINENGNIVYPTSQDKDGKTVYTPFACPDDMKPIDMETEICAGDENVYSIIPKGPPCGSSGGFCLPFRPDGWANDDGDSKKCPSGTKCKYQDDNVKGKGQSCGSRFGATCQYPGNNLHCPDGYEWEVGSGADCGAELYCCYNYKDQENAIKKYDCANVGDGYACKTANNENGFCDSGTCTKCFEYGELCSNDYKCKDQAGNEEENPDGPCGSSINGDCTLARGMRCDSNDH